MKGQLWVAAALVAAGCSSTPTLPDPDDAPLPLVRLQPAPFSFTYNSNIREAQRRVIRDEASWNQFWDALWTGTPPERPRIDFSREVVVVAALGERATGGHSIFVDSATRSARGAVVSVRTVSPGPRCGVTAALTSPVDLARMPQLAGAVTFNETSDVQNCD